MPPDQGFGTSMIVVSNSSPVIALHQIGQLDLLESLFGIVHIPPAVGGEVRSVGPLPVFLQVRELADGTTELALPANLGSGEIEAITLARQMKADQVLLDDLPARRFACELGLPVMGTLGILIAARNRGLLTVVRPSLELLVTHGFRVSPTLFQAVLHTAGE